MRSSAFGRWDCALLFHCEAVSKFQLPNHHQFITIISDSTARILEGKSYFITMKMSSSALRDPLNTPHLSQAVMSKNNREHSQETTQPT